MPRIAELYNLCFTINKKGEIRDKIASEKQFECNMWLDFFCGAKGNILSVRYSTSLYFTEQNSMLVRNIVTWLKVGKMDLWQNKEVERERGAK